MTQGALALTILFFSFIFLVLASFFRRIRLFFLTIGFFVGLSGFFGVYTNLLPQSTHTVAFPSSFIDYFQQLFRYGEPHPLPFYYYGIDLNNLDATPTQKLADAGEIVIFGKVGGSKGTTGREAGKGQCPLCHQFNAGDIGERAPNLLGIIERAERRIKEPRYLNPDTIQHESFPGSGRATTADEYIAESHVCPSCYVAKGFGVKGSNDRSSPMAPDHKDPISLTIEEMIFVHTWLHVHDGKKPPLPSQIRANHEKFIPEDERIYAASLDNSKRSVVNVGIDPQTMALAWDTPEEMIKKMGCAACHRIPTIRWAKVGIIGPLLIGGTNAAQRIASPEYQTAFKAGNAYARTPREYIIESIMNPSAFIVSGFPALKGKSPMPSNFGEKFAYTAVENLADFLLSLDKDMAIQAGLDRSPFAKEGSLFN